MARKPRILDNFVMNATRNNMAKFATVSTEVDAALNGSGFTSLYNDYHPQHLGFMNAYSVGKNQKGDLKKDTATLQALLKGLVPAVANWAYTIEGVYKKGTPEYLAIFPRGRAAFYKGKQVDRVAAVHQLSLSLTGIASLASVKTSVDTYYTNLNAALVTQKTSKSTTNVKRTLLEQQWQNACESMYYVIAGLMQQFNNNTQEVANYIPFHLIDPAPQTVFTGKLPVEGIKVLAKRTMKPAAEVTMINNGTVPADFYVSYTKEGKLPIGATPVTVQPGMTVKVPVSQLGSLENKYFTVRNTSDVAEADYELSL